MDAIHLQGQFGYLRDILSGDSLSGWLLDYPSVSYPSSAKSLQSAVLDILKQGQIVQNLEIELYSKLDVTLAKFEEEIREPLPPFPSGWFNGAFKAVFEQLPLYLRMCWLKTISGAWCTAVRLSSVENRCCVFGCIDARDSLVHYLVCPILWQFARETLNVSEPAIVMPCRLCLKEPTYDSFKLLAFCHSLHHKVVNDPLCMNMDGHPCCSQIVQLRAIDLAKDSRYLVGEG